MENNSKLGTNKTGVDMSPKMTADMLKGMDKFVYINGTGSAMLESLKSDYLDSDQPLGSVPIPGTVKGMVKSTLKMATGHHPEVFINKLGERLAFERAGVRLYEQLILKCKHSTQQGFADSTVPIDKLEEFHQQEAEHFHMLVDCLEQLGADPTAQTPDADASSVAASGLMKVIVDPRTSISQTLEAMLAIELTDNAAWDLLIKLAHDMGLDDMQRQFEHALQQEDIHLAHVREWYETTVRKQGVMSLT